MAGLHGRRAGESVEVKPPLVSRRAGESMEVKPLLVSHGGLAALQKPLGATRVIGSRSLAILKRRVLGNAIHWSTARSQGVN